MKKGILFCVIMIVLSLTGCQKPIIEIEEIDSIAPVLSLQGPDVVFLQIGATYNEPGVIVTDNVDEEINVTVTGNDFSTADYGHYWIQYDAIDQAGNAALSVQREIYVAKQKPGVLSSYVYESCDFVGFSVSIFDWEDNVETMIAYLYDGDQIVGEYDLVNGERSFLFQGLTLNSQYEYVIRGTYDLGGDLGTYEFSTTPLTVGTYRTLEDDFAQYISDPAKFMYIQEMFRLPFDPSNDIFIHDEMLELELLEIEFLKLVALWMEETIIYVDGPITSLYEYSLLRFEETYAGGVYDDAVGVCCNPIAIDIGYGGSGVLLHELGHAIDNGLMGISIDPDFLHAFEEERYNFIDPESYLTVYPHEYFAEMFQYYYLSDFTRTQLQNVSPLTYEFMANLYEILELYYPILFE